jgi:hypothetical protein
MVEGNLLSIPGVKIIAKQGDRYRFLVDRTQCHYGSLEANKVQIMADIPMTLEDLFVALTSETVDVAA